LLSIAKTELEQRVLELCERVLQDFRIVDLDLHITGRSLVRVFIDPIAPDSAAPSSTSPLSTSPRSTSIEDCVTASRLLGPILDAENLIPGGYDLEVSSPGLDRRLRIDSDFEQCIGKPVKVKLVESLDDEEGLNARTLNYSGILSQVAPDSRPTLILKVNAASEVEIPFRKIKKANLVWPKN
jgi:ribosome maturation factor RimP